MQKAKYSVKTVTYELFTTDPAPCFLRDVVVSARADSSEQEKSEVLKRLKEEDDRLYFRTGYEIDTITYEVESFKMESIFPLPKWTQLAYPDADDFDANECESRLYWKYQKVLEDRSFGTEKPADKYFDCWFYTYDDHSHSAYKENQLISE